MKTFLIITILLTLFNACSSNNAFSEFHITEAQEKSEDSILSSKIYDANRVIGVVSAVYLNRIFPEKYHDFDVFYVYLYTKEKGTQLSFILNKIQAKEVQHLEAKNQFSDLIPYTGDWQNYYLVKFTKKEDKILRLRVKTKNSSSELMLFHREI